MFVFPTIPQNYRFGCNSSDGTIIPIGCIFTNVFWIIQCTQFCFLARTPSKVNHIQLCNIDEHLANVCLLQWSFHSFSPTSKMGISSIFSTITMQYYQNEWRGPKNNHLTLSNTPQHGGSGTSSPQHKVQIPYSLVDSPDILWDADVQLPLVTFPFLVSYEIFFARCARCLPWLRAGFCQSAVTEKMLQAQKRNTRSVSGADVGWRGLRKTEWVVQK